MAQQRWRAAEILRLGIGEGKQLVYARPTYTARALERPQAALLASCERFRTLEEHARAAVGHQLAPGDASPLAKLSDRLTGRRRVAAARAQLQMFARDGFLISEENLIDRCMSARAMAHPAGWPRLTISKVSVITSDPVASLERCL